MAKFLYSTLICRRHSVLVIASASASVNLRVKLNIFFLTSKWSRNKSVVLSKFCFAASTIQTLRAAKHIARVAEVMSVRIFIISDYLKWRMNLRISRWWCEYSMLKIKCGERKVERAKYSELITCPLIKFIYFRIKK